MTTTILTDLAQIVMDFAIAVNAAALQPGMLDQTQQSLVVFGAYRLRLRPPRCNNHRDALSASGKEPSNRVVARALLDKGALFGEVSKHLRLRYQYSARLKCSKSLGQFRPAVPEDIRELALTRPRTFRSPKTKPHLLSQMGFRNLILTMTYSHMGKPHTTIGDASFHY